MLIIHFFINVGMVMGMMPITGIPLLFLSYGGSSLLTAMSCMGLLMSINYRRYDFSKLMEIAMNFIFVALGGALGAVGRYTISLIPVKTQFPILTLITNLIGAFIIN